jgi:hypothetical protein
MSNSFASILGITAFAAVILSGLADLILADTGTKFYFTSGALVFRRQIKIKARHSNTPPPSLLEKRLSTSGMRAFTFKELESNEYGFHYKLFSLTWKPATHGLIVFDTENNLVTVKGYLNWLVISLTILILIILPFLWFITGNTLTEFLNQFGTGLIGCGLIFGIPYIIDLSRLTTIAATAAELWSRKHASNDERA